MALKYNGALWTPLESSQEQPAMVAHDIICFHTMVGYLISTDGYFRSGGWSGTESHFGTGGIWGSDLGGGMDGKLFQWQDLMYSADANYHGSRRVISIENADNAASPIAPFTDKQVDTLVELCDTLCDPAFHRNCPTTWQCRHEGIPRSLIPDTKVGRRGLGYHKQGVPKSRYSTGDDWLVPGGVQWSTSPGKGCPDPLRIAQVTRVIIPRLRGEGGDELSAEDVQAITKAIADNNNEILGIVERAMLVLMQGKGNQRFNTTRMPWLGEARTRDLTEVAGQQYYYGRDARNGAIYTIPEGHQFKVHIKRPVWDWMQTLAAVGGKPPFTAVDLKPDVLDNIDTLVLQEDLEDLFSRLSELVTNDES